MWRREETAAAAAPAGGAYIKQTSPWLPPTAAEAGAGVAQGWPEPGSAPEPDSVGGGETTTTTTQHTHRKLSGDERGL